MKSIKTLPPQPIPSPTKLPSLPTIEQVHSNARTKRERIQAACAFHANETITNFCKNSGCYLPLCPKCVKIHMEEHGELGTAGRFQAIEDCLDQAHQAMLNVFGQATKLQKSSMELEQSYQAKKEQTLREFQRLKLIAFQHLSDALKIHEEALHLHLAKQDKAFTQNLIAYHDTMSSMMEACRNGSKKFGNKSTVMEGLIGFYSKDHYGAMLRECQDKLRGIAVTKIEVVGREEVLGELEGVVRRYLLIGESGTTMDRLIAEQKLYKAIEQQPSTSGRYSLGSSIRPNPESPIFPNYLKLTTILDNYSLQRSRNTRIHLDKRQQQQQQTIKRYSQF